MGLARRDNGLHSYGEYLSWDDCQRWELIDGVAYAMAGASADHQRVVVELSRQLATQLTGQPCEALVAPLDVRLPTALEGDEDVITVVQPDVVVVCDRRKLDDRGVRGAPDLVVEVLSPSSASYDLIFKRRAYERAGVREFWLVHPIERHLAIYRLEAGVYGKPDVQHLEGETRVGVLDGVTIRWELVTARLSA